MEELKKTVSFIDVTPDGSVDNRGGKEIVSSDSV